MSEYGTVRDQIRDLMNKAGRLIESLPTEGQRNRMHGDATDMLIEARNTAMLMADPQLLADAFREANRRYWRRAKTSDEWSVRAPELRLVTTDSEDAA